MLTDVWVAKDPGLGYKDYGHKDYCNIDALRYGVEFLGKWKGEQKMGTIFDKVLVGGGLYCMDNDGKFVRVMTVTDIETDDDLRYMNSRIKVEGYAVPDSKAETDQRRILSSVSERWDPENHIYFMIFDGTDLSVKIDRTFIGRIPDYTNPYRVTVYDAGKILWTKTYYSWNYLQCTFLYEIGAALNASFSPISITGSISRMLLNAKKVVDYSHDDCDDERKELERDKNRMKAFLNYAYGTVITDNAFMTVSSNSSKIDNVIFDDPATVILWKDGTKTVVHAQDGEPYDKEKGFAMAVCKKVFGNKRDYYHVFKRWFRKGEDRSSEYNPSSYFKCLVDEHKEK